MNQQQLINNISDRVNRTYARNLSKPDIEAMLKALAYVATQVLSTKDGEIPLPGLGKLKAVTKAARAGRNPATGAEIEIPARNVVKFSAAKALKDALA